MLTAAVLLSYSILKNILQQMERYQEKQKDYEAAEANFENNLESKEDQRKNNFLFRNHLLGV